MQGGPWYATREMVKSASDVRETARLNAAIDRNLEAWSRNAEAKLVLLHFYPVLATRYFDWPDRQMGGPWELYLGDSRLISVTAATSGDDALTPATDLFLEPVNAGPPYSSVRINSASDASWSSGDSGAQRALSLTGLWGHSDTTASAGVLESAIADTVTTLVDVTDSYSIGVGDLIQVENERMVVTGKRTIDTGVNSASALSNEQRNSSLSVPDGTVFTPGEVITIDVERMRIDDVVGNTLSVARAWDGTVLAAHNTGADIYAPRRLVVRRGFGGTTAVAHADATAISRWVPPALLSTWVQAETQNAIAQENSAWARVIGSSEAERETFARGLVDLRKQVRQALGRIARKAAI